MQVPHVRNASFIYRTRVSMHKISDTKKANKHAHKENQTE